MARRTYDTIRTARTSRDTTYTTARSYSVDNQTSTVARATVAGPWYFVRDDFTDPAQAGCLTVLVKDNTKGSSLTLRHPTAKEWQFTATDAVTPMTYATGTISFDLQAAELKIIVDSAFSTGDQIKLVDYTGDQVILTATSSWTTGTNAAIAAAVVVDINASSIKMTASSATADDVVTVTLAQDGPGVLGNTIAMWGPRAYRLQGGLGLSLPSMHGATITIGDDGSGGSYKGTCDAGAQASISLKFANDISTISTATPGAGTLAFGTVSAGTKATTTITVADNSKLTAADKISIYDFFGNENIVTADSLITSPEPAVFKIETSATGTATNLAEVINSFTYLSASSPSTSSVVTITQVVEADITSTPVATTATASALTVLFRS